ncbi:unnamed protein product, partial [Cunninghamella blakesleeana]
MAKFSLPAWLLSLWSVHGFWAFGGLRGLGTVLPEPIMNLENTLTRVKRSTCKIELQVTEFWSTVVVVTSLFCLALAYFGFYPFYWQDYSLEVLISIY